MPTLPVSETSRSPLTPPSEHSTGDAANPVVSPRVRVQLNGAMQELPSPSLHAALEQLSLRADTRHVAIAVNDTVVPRAAWDDVQLHANDRVEIITAVAGG